MRSCLLLLVATSVALTGGCDRKSEAPPELHVFAASSLRDIMSDFEERFESANDVEVKLVLADSATLRTQIEQGARPDVFATDQLGPSQVLVDRGLLTAQAVFAEDELALVVPATNPAGIEQFEQLSKAGVILLAAAEDGDPSPARVVDAGEREYGAEFAAKVRAAISDESEDVRRVRAALESGKADAAIMRRTDAIASPRLRVIPIPERLNERIRFAHAVVHGTKNRRLARKWLRLISSEEGRTTLERWGYVLP